MSMDAQSLIVSVVLGGAAAYLARRGWLAFARKKSSGCGGCSSCPSPAGRERELPMVSVDSLIRRDELAP
jgi:hypothetical protein